MEGILIVTAVVSLAAGIAISYWLMEKRLAKQKLEHKKQASQAISEAERSHESRMQQRIESVRSKYESQLQESRQIIAQSESLQSQYERELEESRQKIASLERNEATSKSLQSQYERELEENRQKIAQLERASEERSQEITKFLGQQYEIMWKQVQLAELAQIEQEKKKRRSPVEEVTSMSPGSTSFPGSAWERTTQETSLPELYQNVTAWGESGQTKSIGQLTRYTNHQNGDVRRLVASGLGKIAASNSMRAEIERLIPTLGKLSQDAKPEVRQAAVEALGMIKSVMVLPFLQRALKDPVGNVRKSANASIRKLNLGYGFKPKEQIKPTEVKKPKR